MFRAIGGHALQEDLAGALVPAFRAIGASIGPDGRHVVYSTGNRVATAASGSEIARRVCSDHFAARLLKETLVEAERDLGDGTARLAVMAGAALAAARRGIAAGAVPERVIAALVALRPALDEAFAAERAEAVDPVAVALAAGAEAELARRLAEACAAVGTAGLVEVAAGQEPGLRLDIRQGFGFDARPVGSAGLDAMGPDRIAARLEARSAGTGPDATAQAMLLAALRAPGICLRRNSGAAEPVRTAPVTDPAGLSRSLLDVALSLAGRLAGLEGAVIRH